MTKFNPSGTSFKDMFQEGTHLLHQGKVEQAIPYLQQAIKLQPENVDAAINLSGAFILDRKFRQAIAVLEPFRDPPSNNTMVWINLGAAYLGNPVLARDTEHKAALDAFKQALTINPLAPSVAYNIGLIYEDRNEYEASIYWFGKALQANPHDKDAQRKIKRLEALINTDDEDVEADA